MIPSSLEFMPFPPRDAFSFRLAYRPRENADICPKMSAILSEEGSVPTAGVMAAQLQYQ
jgi:hypothetical protein